MNQAKFSGPKGGLIQKESPVGSQTLTRLIEYCGLAVRNLQTACETLSLTGKLRELAGLQVWRELLGV